MSVHVINQVIELEELDNLTVSRLGIIARLEFGDLSILVNGTNTMEGEINCSVGEMELVLEASVVQWLEVDTSSPLVPTDMRNLT